MKTPVTFIILLIILLPVMGFITTGDGTLKGRLQTFVSYGLSLTSLLLCLFTIIASTYSLTNDIKQKQLYTVLTKPIHRWELIVGKLFGIIILDIVLLILFSVIIYSITIYTPTFLNADPEQLARLNNEFYTARASLTPPEIDVTKEVQKHYKKLDTTGQLPPGMSRREIVAQLTSQKKLAKRAAGPTQELLWEFENVKPLTANQSLFIRFKYDVSVNPPDLHVFGRFDVGDIRQFKYGNIETPVYRFDRKDIIRTFQEIQVPADAIANDGYLAVRFLNVPLNNTVVIFPPEDGLEVLYKADTFTANFIKSVLLILLRLVFLACLGIFAASFLSFPVAILLSLAVFFTGTTSSFCLESFEALSEETGIIYNFTVRPFVLLLPRFDTFTPAKFLVPARLLSWTLLAKVTAMMVCFKALILLIFGLIIFSYKEIAKVIV